MVWILTRHLINYILINENGISRLISDLRAAYNSIVAIAIGHSKAHMALPHNIIIIGTCLFGQDSWLVSLGHGNGYI